MSLKGDTRQAQIARQKARVERACALRAEGMTFREIARTLGVRAASARLYCRIKRQMLDRDA